MNVHLLRYYRSARWRHHPARAEVLTRAGNRCQGCNTTEQLELHHRYYPRELGTETADTLTVLCRHCHRASSRPYNIRPIWGLSMIRTVIKGF